MQRHAEAMMDKPERNAMKQAIQDSMLEKVQLEIDVKR
jgi:hypothetical protein